MNSTQGKKMPVQVIYPVAKSFLPVESGQKLIRWLIWCVASITLATGVLVAVAHTLARTTDMPPMQILVAQLYTNDIWWHPTDKAYAKVLLRRAVAAGDVKAQYRLARDYENEKNHAEAFSLHQDLALKGWADSQMRLGLMYLDGEGVRQDADLAVRWLKSAAAQGNASAHFFLGLIYLGELPGSTPDIAQAMQWFHSSANLGDGQARDMLARFYATGKGVPKNLELAMEWANSSLDAGYTEATKTIQLIQTIKTKEGEGNGQ